jgi:hypothetical protein
MSGLTFAQREYLRHAISARVRAKFVGEEDERAELFLKYRLARRCYTPAELEQCAADKSIPADAVRRVLERLPVVADDQGRLRIPKGRS